ncbi:hypothetical protein, partial [Lacisediminimonas sp.]|uniref:hypothetical protein n=1 Tax=Lacisediminimonas sp. TaxID=3060582 RepID=UPI002728E9FC
MGTVFTGGKNGFGWFGCGLKIELVPIGAGAAGFAAGITGLGTVFTGGKNGLGCELKIELVPVAA